MVQRGKAVIFNKAQQSLIIFAIHSTTQANSKGEIGHPCLTPLFRFKALEFMLLIRTLLVAEVYNNCIQFMNSDGNAILSSTWSIKSWSTLSKAF